MLKPVRLLFASLRQFAIGLGPAIVMAFACLFIQIALWKGLSFALIALFVPREEVPLEEMMNHAEHVGAYDWRQDAAELFFHTGGVAAFFFFHALVALILTAWLLRRRAGFDRIRVLRRALWGAGLLTGAAALVFAAAYFVDNLLRATRDLSFDFKAAAVVAVWFLGTALLLPARVMGHQPVAASGLSRNTLIATMALVPWFYASEVLGAPLRHCHECGGFFEGAFVFYPLLGAYLLGLTVSSAAVSAAACMPGPFWSAAALPPLSNAPEAQP